MILLLTALFFLLYGDSHCQEQTHRVTGPRTWRVGVQETVIVQVFGQRERFPVNISLLSYPDKNVTFASQHLVLTPANHYQGLVNLAIKPEDLPHEDEERRFVCLVVESKAFFTEEKVPVTDHKATESVWKKRKRSLRLHENPEIHKLATKYRTKRVQQCCLNGSAYYKQQWDCNKGLSEIAQEELSRCYNAFKECCEFTMEQWYKDLPIGMMAPQHIEPIQPNEQLRDVVRLSVTQTISGRRVVSLFNVMIDPTQDVLVRVSGKGLDITVDLSVGTAAPVTGYTDVVIDESQ